MKIFNKFMILLWFLSGCSFGTHYPEGLNKYEKEQYTMKVRTLDKYIKNTVTDDKYNMIVQELDKIVPIWIEKYTNTAFFEEGNYIVSEKMIFNKEENEVVFFVIDIYEELNDGKIKILSGKKDLSGEWDLSLGGYSVYYSRKERPTPISYKELEYRGMRDLVEDGLVKFGKVNQERIYILANSWVEME